MTMIAEDNVTCASCGASVDVMMLLSTSSFGSMDLDTRPPGLARFTLSRQIDDCPQCGYRSRGLEALTGVDLPAAVRCPEYLTILADERFPQLARDFLAFRHLCQLGGHARDALWATLCAVWACDDEDLGAEARTLREEALGWLDRLHAEGQTFSGSHDHDALLTLDLARRTGHFDDVVERADTFVDRLGDGFEREIARFQRSLAQQRDTQTHTVEEAIEWAESPHPDEGA